ncbi:MAG TPA: AEC family transporter [Zeimonas sp.]
MALFGEIVLPVFVLIALGFVAARRALLGAEGVRALSDAAFLIFMPALLFGAIARVDFDRLTPGAAFAYYAVGLPLFAAVLFAQWMRGRGAATATIRALGSVFGNTVMLGIPVVRLAYGETGLAFLLTIIAWHALVFLSLGALVLETALLGRRADGQSSWRRLAKHLLQVARAALIHPVVLPILAGLAWSALHWTLPVPLDRALGMLGAAAAPLCLVLLGASLAQFELRAGLASAAALTLVKSVLFPLLVWGVGTWMLRLEPLPLAVATVAAALPTGANVYLFAQRYQTQVGEVSATVALSTLAAALTLPWLLYRLPAAAAL